MIRLSFGNRKQKGLFWVMPICLTFALAVAGQGFWEKKPPTAWKPDECQKILRDSPWAVAFQQTNVHMVPIEAETADRRREPNPQYSYVARFWSALPVRQATVRLRQIQMKYDALAPEAKRAFDQQSSQFLDQKFDDRIVLSVVFQSNVDGAMRDGVRLWRSASREQLKNEVFLNAGRGKKVDLLRYTFAGADGQCEFYLEFPRTLNGEPLITPDQESINIELRHPEVTQFPAGRVFIEFKLKPMKYKGALTL